MKVAPKEDRLARPSEKKIQNALTWYIVSQKVLLPAIFYFSNRIIAQAAHAPQDTDVKQDLLIKDTDEQVFCTLIMRVVDK